MKNDIKVGDRVVTVGKYSGIVSKPYTVVKVSTGGNKVTIYKPEFATGKEEFTFKPTNGNYSNDYTGTVCKCK